MISGLPYCTQQARGKGCGLAARASLPRLQNVKDQRVRPRSHTHYNIICWERQLFCEIVLFEGSVPEKASTAFVSTTCKFTVKLLRLIRNWLSTKSFASSKLPKVPTTQRRFPFRVLQASHVLRCWRQHDISLKETRSSGVSGFERRNAGI